MRERVMWPRVCEFFHESTDDFLRGIGFSCHPEDLKENDAFEELCSRSIHYLRDVVATTISKTLDSKTYKKSYMPAARSQHKRRITARIVNLAWSISVGSDEPYSNCSDDGVKYACQHLVAELSLFKAVAGSLPRWLRLSSPFTFLFIRLCAIDCHVIWQNVINHEGFGIQNTPDMVDSFREDKFNIRDVVEKVKNRVQTQLLSIRLGFVHNGDISIDLYDPAAVDAGQLADSEVYSDDISEELDRVAGLVVALNEVVPLICVVDQQFSETLSALWRSEGGSSTNWKWRKPEKKDLGPAVFYENGNPMDIFRHMMLSIESSKTKMKEAKADAETELSALAVISHMCAEIAKMKHKTLSVYGYMPDEEDTELDIRNVPLQNMVHGVWKSAVRANVRVHEALSSKFGVGTKDLRSALGVLNETYWTGLAVKKRDSPRYSIQKDVVSTFFFMSLICTDQFSSVREAATEYAAQMA